VASFPRKFGLRAFPNREFTINPSQCYETQGEYMLYVFTEDGQAFCKGSPDELRREIVVEEDFVDVYDAQNIPEGK
jgi:hypothetical protein